MVDAHILYIANYALDSFGSLEIFLFHSIDLFVSAIVQVKFYFKARPNRYLFVSMPPRLLYLCGKVGAHTGAVRGKLSVSCE